MGSSGPIPAATDVLLVGTSPWIEPLATALESDTGASVHVRSSIDETVETIATADVDCVVTDVELDDGTGIDLLETVRDGRSRLPLVVCTDAGSEQLANDALATGATDYIALSTPGMDTAEVTDRIAEVLRSAQRERNHRERGRQFDAIFRDTQTATWVLDPAGHLERANGVARAMVDVDIGSLTGRPFWDLPWWTNSAGTRSEIRHVVTGAIDGGETERVVTELDGGGQQILELTILPVRNPQGDIVAVVVEGNDITDEVGVYRELRESENLHRVTLNNMTDTVLITDDAGAFTYVCPNVHFIFGYSVDEIREFGTIDRLLGEDLFDPEDLAREGVLTNIECTATDKHGEEHTLLVNVREVDIQDGDVLFSCRDITKRKQRETALTTLHGTTQNLQYAETKAEIAQTLVDDASSVLDLSALALYLYDTADNTLRAVARSEQLKDLHGPPSTYAADDESLVGYSFVNDYPRYYDDLRDADRLAAPATELRSGAFVPIGDHGLLFAGSVAEGQFDRIRRELTELIAATAEAAFDRVDRDSRLRTQERTLKRQNQQLTQLDRLNELIRDIDRSLVQAETRAEIEQTVCDALTSSAHYAFAWIGELDAPTDRIEATAWGGDDEGYLDSIQPMPVTDSGEPASRTAATRAVTVVSNVATEIRQDDWQTAALRRGFQSAIGVPLVYDGVLYGILTIYADSPERFDGEIRTTLGELGETIASALSALNRKNALLSSSGTRLEFETRDRDFVPLRLARRAGSSITFEGGVQRGADGVAIFVTVDDAAVDDVVAQADELVSIPDCQVLNRGKSEALLRLELGDSFLGLDLADHGAVLRRADVTASTATLVVDVPTTDGSQPIRRHVLESLEATELTAKHEAETTPTHELYSTFLDQVTDRQLEVVKTAYYSGFFESPREQTGEEVANTLGISGPAFYEHTRTVQRKLFRALFDEIGVPSTGTVGH